MIADVAPFVMLKNTGLAGVPRIGVGSGVRVEVEVEVEGGSGVNVGAARWVAATMVAIASGEVEGTAAGAQPASTGAPSANRRNRAP